MNGYVEEMECAKRKTVEVERENMDPYDDSLTLLDNLPLFINFNVRSLMKPIDKDGGIHSTYTSKEINNTFSIPSLTELITQCLQECNALQVKEIYEWISNRCPFYKKEDHSWKNAVRHTLSTKGQFRKIGNAKRKGYTWFLDLNASAVDVKRKRLSKKYKNTTTKPVIVNAAQCFNPSQSGVNVYYSDLDGYNVAETTTLYFQVYDGQNIDNSKQFMNLNDQINCKKEITSIQNQDHLGFNESYSYLANVSSLQLEIQAPAKVFTIDDNVVSFKSETADIELLK